MTNAQIFWYIIITLVYIWWTYLLNRYLDKYDKEGITKYGETRWKDQPINATLGTAIMCMFLLWIVHVIILLVNIIPPFNAWLNSL